MDDLLVVGEALVDIVVRPGADPVEHPGGSPANVALGLGRLGRSPALLTHLARDERGLRIRDHLTASGVTLLPGSFSAEATSTATAHLDAHGVATYDFDITWALPERVGTGAVRALHTGSIAAFLSPGADAVLDLVERLRATATISYDPNARPRLMGDAGVARARVEHLVSQADLVKVSDEDLAWLCPSEDPDDVIRAWLATGPSIVVLTRGPGGATGLCAAGRVDVPAPVVAVVDTVGAGDAFMSGLIDHLAETGVLGVDRRAALRGLGLDHLEAVVRHAVTVAAFTCTRAGAQPPTRADLASLPPAPPSP